MEIKAGLASCALLACVFGGCVDDECPGDNEFYNEMLRSCERCPEGQTYSESVSACVGGDGGADAAVDATAGDAGDAGDGADATTGDAEVDAAPMDATPDASAPLGKPCEDSEAHSDCEPEAPYCAKSPFDTVGYCTISGCALDPDDCPDGYHCDDVAVGFGAPTFCAPNQ